jgi:hypothetical protein
VKFELTIAQKTIVNPTRECLSDLIWIKNTSGDDDVFWYTTFSRYNNVSKQYNIIAQTRNIYKYIFIKNISSQLKSILKNHTSPKTIYPRDGIGTAREYQRSGTKYISSLELKTETTLLLDITRTEK